MKRAFIIIETAIASAVIVFAAAAGQNAPALPSRIIINFNSRWLFAKGDIPNGQSDTLHDSSFQPVCLPHANALVPHRDIDQRSFWNISWYRRHFSPPMEYKGRRFFLEFQGASQVTEVFVNGTPVGKHLGAYTPFTFDITGTIRFGADNVVAVRVDSRKHRDIPPEGLNVDYMLFGGMTRNVTIVITDPLHLEWIFAPRDSADPNRLRIHARVKNSGASARRCILRTEVLDSAGTVVATGAGAGTVGADSSLESMYRTEPIKLPCLWDIDRPYLYRVRTVLGSDSARTDELTVKTGLRKIAFSKIDGKFYINGRPLRLRGLNRHETYPFIGRAASDRLQAKDADILRYDLGCNVVRCSHYPQGPAFLDRCDEIGLLVLEEVPGWIFVGDTAWRRLVIQNVEEMVMRDRNHPSLISYGVRVNESFDIHDLYQKTNRLSRSLDPTRPTHGVRVAERRNSITEFFEDVWTQNFTIPQGKPRPMPWLVTESVGVSCPTHSWDGEQQLIRQMRRFAEVQDSVGANENIAGALGWCAFDYNSGYFTADRSINYHGVADIFRTPKHAGMFFRSQESAGPMVYIAHCWKQALAPNDVWVTGNCDQVELFVNGRSLGKKTPDQYPSLPHPLAVWKGVPFKPGEIKAVGYIKDTVAATCVRTTPGPPVALKIIPDDTALIAGGDMTRLVVVAVDRHGQTVPGAKNPVALSVTGVADFIGMSPIALEDGKTAFFVKTRADETGGATCKAWAPGLTSASARITVSDDPQAPLRRRVLGL